MKKLLLTTAILTSTLMSANAGPRELLAESYKNKMSDLALSRAMVDINANMYYVLIRKEGDNYVRSGHTPSAGVVTKEKPEVYKVHEAAFAQVKNAPIGSVTSITYDSKTTTGYAIKKSAEVLKINDYTMAMFTSLASAIA
ncbi:MAG: hypothetical protein NTX76_01815 [Alphaproteobacteria bacterium]|nr:hypothetical protein [Alphaproteobacteria bacterium]